MSRPIEYPQRIGRLASLGEVQAALEGMVRAVGPTTADVSDAINRILGADVVAAAASPATPVALRDGWAVHADTVSDAGPYAPVPFPLAPQWIDLGELMPAGTDAVLLPDCVTEAGGHFEAIASAAIGDGVLPAGADAQAAHVLRHAGQRLRASDIAVLQTLGVDKVSIRVPRIAVIAAKAADRDAVMPLIRSAIEAQGGAAQRVIIDASDGAFARALRACEADAFITIGGTGGGRSDRAVCALAEVGSVALHGMAIAPGETAALGSIAGRPVLMLPGRLDAALAVWLLVGRLLLDRLTGAWPAGAGMQAVLTRKITSTLGMTEVVLIRLTPAGAVPLASRHFPLAALAQADGWAVVPPDSEGFPAGVPIEVHSLP